METWADEAPLYIWSGGARADLAALKAAKAELEFDKKVKPIGLDATGAQLPDPFARVLAIGSRPLFLCDYALTGDRTSPEGWKRALAWCLGLVEHDEKATTTLDILISIMGKGVREISPEELEGERKLAAYLNRTE